MDEIYHSSGIVSCQCVGINRAGPAGINFAKDGFIDVDNGGQEAAIRLLNQNFDKLIIVGRIAIIAEV